MEACEGMLLFLISDPAEQVLTLLQNLAFAKDEAKFSMKKLQNKVTGGLSGREPDIETETG